MVFSLGLLFSLFKLFASIVTVILLLHVFGRIFGEKKASFRSVFVGLILFGIFRFFVKKLINGDRVLKIRQQTEH